MDPGRSLSHWDEGVEKTENVKGKLNIASALFPIFKAWNKKSFSVSAVSGARAAGQQSPFHVLAV